MDNKKEQERAELHRTIWNIANDLRGSVDGWDFKQYVLGMLFYRYISENITAYINAGEHEVGDAAFDYAKLADSDAEQAREDLVKTKGFFILPGELFENVRRRAKEDENLNETLENVFKAIEASARGTDSEINITTYNLCRINMFLHDIDYDKFDIGHGDTLTDPLHWDDEPFEAIVSNPPYSIKWAGDGSPVLINDPRFSPAGVLAPKSKADLAFIMHSLAWLAASGTAAIVCFPGVMYRGGAEKKIRQYLIDNNYIDCVIQLPDNLFYGTSIATCIMVLKKSKAENSTLFIDASKEFVKVTNNNKLTPQNIDAILEAFKDRQDREHFSRLVPNSTIAGEDYNLSVSTYVEQEDTREKIDIAALNAEIKAIVARQQVLRDGIDRIIAALDPPGRQITEPAPSGSHGTAEPALPGRRQSGPPGKQEAGA